MHPTEANKQVQLLTCRVSCLYHELLDDSVEDVSIIVAITAMNTEVLHWLGTATGGKYQYSVWLVLKEKHSRKLYKYKYNQSYCKQYAFNYTF